MFVAAFLVGLRARRERGPGREGEIRKDGVLRCRPRVGKPSAGAHAPNVAGTRAGTRKHVTLAGLGRGPLLPARPDRPKPVGMVGRPLNTTSSFPENRADSTAVPPRQVVPRR